MPASDDALAHQKMQMFREFIAQDSIFMSVGEKYLNRTFRIWRRRGHSTGYFVRGIVSSALGLTAVSLLPAYLTPVGKGLHASRRIPALVCSNTGLQENGPKAFI